MKSSLSKILSVMLGMGLIASYNQDNKNECAAASQEPPTATVIICGNYNREMFCQIEPSFFNIQLMNPAKIVLIAINSRISLATMRLFSMVMEVGSFPST